MHAIPEIRKDEKGIPTLYIDGAPFFCYSGEVHNSSASYSAYMEKTVWPAVRRIGLNSVILPVYWEQIEETEGTYCFDVLDEVIAQARRENVKLILLWFGLWKNSESMYVPGWMKRDTEKYFRVIRADGRANNSISPLCAAAVEKDKAAFTALMTHLRDTDSKDRTVIIIQMENEIGTMGSDRDYSEAAEEAFYGAIPAALAELTGRNGTWREVYGENAAESFMAAAYAAAVEKITSAGREIYPLPCYVNAWLYQYPWYPGSYPVGGPVKQVHPIWKCLAPSLFTVGPDIYVPDVADVMDAYSYDGNPLFIPEIRKDAVAASYCLYAFAAKNAIGFSPFGFEDLILDPDEIQKPPMEVMIALNIDPSAIDITGSCDCLAASYSLMKEMEPILLKYRGTESIKAFVKHGDTDFGTYLKFSSCDVLAAYKPKEAAKPLPAGFVIEEEEDTFLVGGFRSTLKFMPKSGDRRTVGLISIEEGHLENGIFIRERILNGDENMSIGFGDMPSCLRVKLFHY